MPGLEIQELRDIIRNLFSNHEIYIWKCGENWSYIKYWRFFVEKVKKMGISSIFAISDIITIICPSGPKIYKNTIFTELWSK